MTPADLEAFRVSMHWTRKDIGRELEISQDRLRRLLSGSVRIPRHIELACLSFVLVLGNAKRMPRVLPAPAIPAGEATPMPVYQGKKVTIVRPARQGDKDFDAAKGPQSVIKLPDGSEKTVATTEVTDE